jgi:Putative transposase
MMMNVSTAASATVSSASFVETSEAYPQILTHVLPHGFHRIRHYGLLASGTRADNIAQARRLLDRPAAQPEPGDNSCAEAAEPKPLEHPCPCCSGRMIIIETFQRGCSPRSRPTATPAVIRIDTS